MRWGRSGSPAGLICGKDRMGAPPPPASPPTRSPGTSGFCLPPKTLPPQPEGGGAAARPGDRQAGSLVPGPRRGRGARGRDRPALPGGRELLAAPRRPRRPHPHRPPGGRATRVSLSSPRRAWGATPEAAAATHHITDGGDVSDSH